MKARFLIPLVIFFAMIEHTHNIWMVELRQFRSRLPQQRDSVSWFVQPWGIEMAII